MKTRGELLLSLGFHNYRNYGRFLAKQINRERFVQISLADSGTHEKWDGVRVRVFSKLRGLVGDEVFLFADHCHKGKSDNPYAKDTTIHVWHDRNEGYDFYLVKPRDPGVLCVLIEEWIDEWRT